MRRVTQTFLAASVLASGLAIAAAPGDAAESTFYLRQDGCGAEQQPGRLETVEGGDDADGCGSIGGLPFDEVFNQLGANEPNVFSTTVRPESVRERSYRGGMPIILDATTDVTGQLRAESWFGDGVPGGGQVTFQIKLTMRIDGKSVTIGSATLEATGGGADNQTLEFSIDVDDALDGSEVTGMSFSVTQGGVNVNNTNLGLNGDSFLVVGTREA